MLHTLFLHKRCRVDLLLAKLVFFLCGVKAHLNLWGTDETAARCAGKWGMITCIKPIAVFTLVTRGRFLDVGVKKFNIEPNGGFFDVSPENDRTSLNVKTPNIIPNKLHPPGTLACINASGSFSRCQGDRGRKPRGSPMMRGSPGPTGRVLFQPRDSRA